MTTTIYYFSATGNCLTTAKQVASYFDKSQVIAASSLRNEKEIIDHSDVVGVICPVYYGNTPYIIREVLEKIIFTNHPYIFLLTTCKGHTGIVANRISELLSKMGQKLSIARNIIMPGNSWISTPEENKERLTHQNENIKKEMIDIIERKIEDYLSTEPFKETLVDYPNNFRGIMVDENCIGCGTCVKVCPLGNIEIKDGKALIGNECMTCLSCFHWCPKEAIYMSKEENVARRFKYHHPDVKLIDIINQHKEK